MGASIYMLPNKRSAIGWAFYLLTLFVVNSALSLSAFGHPDLLLQIEALDVQIEANSANAELLVKRGDLYRRHQDYEAAAKDFEAAKNADPGYLLLDFYQGRLLLELGDGLGAERRLSRYLDTHPQHAGAWVLRGEANIHLARSELAAEYFARAIQYSENSTPELYRLHVLALVAGGETASDAALQAVDAGLQQFPLEVSLLGLGTDIALARNRSADAKRYINVLPQALQKLQQWKERLEIADCLTLPGLETRAACLQQARQSLKLQVEDFMRTL